MPIAEIITIGTELLLGEIVDTNTQFIAHTIRDHGIDLYRTQTVGDNAQRIATVICESFDRCDIIITTGGLGPTVDDPTREAIAAAFNQDLVFHEELWEQIQDRFARFNREPTENNRRQAFIPRNAKPITNPVGTAPAFFVHQDGKYVISLPGVPKEMEYLMYHDVIPMLRAEYDLNSRIFTRILHTAGVGESQIDELLGDLERLTNPTVGLAAHTGQVDIRITAKADTEAAAVEMMQPVEDEIRDRLKSWIFGADGETLEKVAVHTLQMQDWRLVAIEIGFGGALLDKLSDAGPTFSAGEMLNPDEAPSDFVRYTREFMERHGAEAGLIAEIRRFREDLKLHAQLITPLDIDTKEYSFGGPPSLTTVWAVNYCLNMLRNIKTPQKDNR